MLKIAKGFSLLELMIVVAIIGILVMIAYPSYQMHVMKSRRTEAKTGLLALAQAQEEYRADNNKYANTLTPPTLTDPIKLNGKEVRIEHQFYDFTLTDTSSLKFKVTATAIATGSQGKDTQCQVFTLDQTGLKTSSPSSDCW